MSKCFSGRRNKKNCCFSDHGELTRLIKRRSQLRWHLRGKSEPVASGGIRYSLDMNSIQRSGKSGVRPVITGDRPDLIGHDIGFDTAL